MKFHHRSALSAASIAMIVATLIIVPATVSIADSPDPSATVERMLEYSPEDFVSEANALPAELVGAVNRDLEVSGEQYLAEAAAATQAPEVVGSLSEAGVDVLGSRMEGTELIVNVADAADKVIVTSAGATAELGEPVPFTLGDADLSFAAEAPSIYGGQGYYYETAGGSLAFQCSIGFNGYSLSGAKELLTAGHCTANASSTVWSLKTSQANVQGDRDAQLGSPVSGSTQVGTGGYDIGRISVPASVNTPASVLTWGNGAGAPLASTPVAITGQAAATVGAPVCKSGSTSGWTCGTVEAVDYDADVDGSIVNSIVTDACTRPGDSGGPLVMGSTAVGVTSWSVVGPPDGVSCGDPNYIAGAFPMNSAAGKASVSAKYGSSWTLAIAANEYFVKKLYTDFLGRPAGESEVQSWAQQISMGRLDRYGVATSLSRSDEWITTVIENFYRNTLQRDPDQAGLQGWINAARNGMPVAQIASAFYSSPEYFANVGRNDNRTWVTDLYPKLLLRTGEQQGIDSWVNALNRGMPRSTVAFGFYQSPETLGVRIDNLYRKLLSRPAEPASAGNAGAIGSWSPFVRNNGDLVLAAALAGSQEYLNLAQPR